MQPNIPPWYGVTSMQSVVGLLARRNSVDGQSAAWLRYGYPFQVGPVYSLSC